MPCSLHDLTVDNLEIILTSLERCQRRGYPPHSIRLGPDLLATLKPLLPPTPSLPPGAIALFQNIAVYPMHHPGVAITIQP